jgi:hypothetical protein
MMPDRVTVDRMLPRAVCLALACLLLAPMAVVRGADPPVPIPIPGEPGARFLDGSAFGGIVADLDGDGARELVRLVPKSDSPGVLAIDAWRVNGDGSWQSLGEAPLTRAASVNEIVSERPAQRNPMRPVGVAEPARFLIWNDGARERLLVATIAASLEPVACCLTVWEVDEPSAGAPIALRLLLSTQGNATSILSLDLDGDPADELFVTQQPDTRGPNDVPVRAYDWNGSAFRESRSSLVAPPGWQAFASGDTDGRPGGEVLISSDPIDNGGGAVLNRFWLTHGQLEMESWAVRARGAIASFDAGDGPQIVIVPAEIGVTLVVRWPAGGAIEYESGASDVGRLLGVLGRGPSTRILIDAHDGGSGFRITGPHLEAVPVPSAVVAAAALQRNGLDPYVGELPGGLSGSAAYIANGQLIDQQPPSSVLRPLAMTAIATLPGISPLGALGPDESWMALFHGRVDTSRNGGALAAPARPAADSISVALTTTVLSPESHSGELRPGFSGAVSLAAGGDQLAIGRSPFTAALSGPPGAFAVSATSGLTGGSGAGTTTTPFRDGAAQLTITPPSGEHRFSLRISVVTPAGHGYTGTWRVDLLDDKPPLSVDTPLAPFSLDVPVSGSTRPGAQLTIDGGPVAVSADGSFAADVSAGLIPRDVHLVATDPVGNVTTHVLSVVGFVDYRRLPWIPVVVALTVAAAIILFLRAPRPRPEPARAPDDDARLEEID